MSEEIVQMEIIESADALVASEKASYDSQITTAKQYPRNVRKAIDNALTIAIMDKETAATCGYALPRGGKTVAGASVHLARIVAAEWGNLRVEAKVVDITRTQIVSQAVCFDLEKNYAVKIEVRRSIVGKRGRFADDMITMTGNAANAIAYRNAVFSVVPKSVIDKIYKETRNLIVGDLSDETKLIAKRKKVLDGLKEAYNATEEEVLFAISKVSVKHITKDDIATLIGLGQAIKDGDADIDEAFGRTKKGGKEVDQKIVDKIQNEIKKPEKQPKNENNELFDNAEKV